MSTSEIIMIIGIALVNIGGLLTVFTNLNVKITETAKDILSLRNDMEEHKNKNRDDIREIKEIVYRDRNENREDHSSLMREIGAIAKNISDLKTDLKDDLIQIMKRR